MTALAEQLERVKRQHELRARLTEWSAIFRQRDSLILAALDAGIAKSEISARTGVARSTIDAILSRRTSTELQESWPAP